MSTASEFFTDGAYEGGAVPQVVQNAWSALKSNKITAICFGLVIVWLIALTVEVVRMSMSSFANNSRGQVVSGTGSNPVRDLAEGSQPGSGGYGRQWKNGMDVYVRPEFQALDSTLANSIEGGRRGDSFANGPEFRAPTANRWSHDAREQKALRQYTSLRQAALAAGNVWNQSFPEWYKTYQPEGMVSKINDNVLMSNLTGA